MAMIAIRVSSLMPVQSSYLPLISLYFFLSLFYSMIALTWFVIMDRFQQKKDLPNFLKKLALNLKHKFRQVHVESNLKKIEINECILIMNEIGFMAMFLIMSISFAIIWGLITN